MSKTKVFILGLFLVLGILSFTSFGSDWKSEIFEKVFQSSSAKVSDEEISNTFHHSLNPSERPVFKLVNLQ